MDRREILEYLGEDWVRTQATIREALESDIQLLNETNGFTLEHSGKQLRPMLALLVAKACVQDGATSADSVRYAAAIELLHNATLFHDDVADCSPTRRGVPTVSSLLGGTASVLLGDFWLVKAVEMVLDSSDHSDTVIKLFSTTLSNLAEGELFQLQKAASGDTTEDDYRRIIYSKTATMFEAACLSAALSVKASEEYKEAVRKYGVLLGLAFQVRDDLLDYEGGDIGKPAGLDLAEQKITLPLLGALASVDEARQKEIRSSVVSCVDHPEVREGIVRFVKENNGLEYARKRLEEYCRQAIDALDPLPDSRAKEYLKELAVYTAQREK